MKRLLCFIIILINWHDGYCQQLSTERVAQILLQLNSAESRHLFLTQNPIYVKSSLWLELNTFGNQYYKLHQLDRAFVVFSVALELGELINQRELIGESLHQLGAVERARNNLDTSFKLLTDAQMMLTGQTLQEKTFRLHLYKDLSLWYREKRDLEKANLWAEECLTISREVADRQGIGIAYYLLGGVKSKSGDYPKAIESYEKSKEFLRENENDRAFLIDVLIDEGEAYSLLAEFPKCRELFTRAEELVGKTNQPLASVRFHFKYATITGAQGKAEEMREHLRLSMSLAKKIGARLYYALASLNLGMSELYAGNYQVADRILTEGLFAAQQLNSPVYLNAAQMDVGLAKIEVEDYRAAQEYLMLALDAYSKMGQKGKSATIYSELGRLFLKENKLAKAVEYAKKAEEMAIELKDRELQSYALSIAGEAYLQQKDDERSRRALEEAIQLNESLLSVIEQNPIWFADYFADRISPYWSLSALNYSRGKLREALLAADKGKSRALLEFISKSGPDKEKDVSKAFTKNPTTVSFDDIERLIPDEKSALLYYTCTSKSTYVYAVTHEKEGLRIQTFLIPIAEKALGAKVEAFRQQLETRSLDFRKSSKELFNLLIAPAVAALKGKTNLCISPDGPIWDLPFQALTTTDNRFLVETTAITRVPSLNVWNQQSAGSMNVRKELEPRGHFLGIGNPTLDSQLAQKYKPLPEAVGEVTAIAKINSTRLQKILSADEATEAVFKSQASYYRYLHLAAHGVFDNEHPLDSMILLKGSPGEDGALHAAEIMNLDLHADMVVLSACDTARGKLSRGEGVLSLAWAFSIAGVPTTVVSQWAVDSAATEALMVEFYKQLSENNSRAGAASLGRAEALRQAQLRLMHRPEYREPYFWGGFEVIGEGN